MDWEINDRATKIQALGEELEEMAEGLSTSLRASPWDTSEHLVDAETVRDKAQAILDALNKFEEDYPMESLSATSGN
jgi:hypothetical protein